MLSKIKAFFENEFVTEDGGELSQEQLNLACAALLIEVAIIDQEFDHREFEQMKAILQDQFAIASADCDALIALAQQEHDDASSMYQFTQLVNAHCTTESKMQLIKGMWEIAYADGELDKYEEYIIRKTSELIHLAHSDFIRAKHLARSARPE